MNRPRAKQPHHQLTDDEKGELEKLDDAAALADRLNGEWKRRKRGRPRRVVWRWSRCFRPLGWDWKIGVAAMASFPAREVIVGTFGLLYDVGEVDTKAIGNADADDESKEKAAGLTNAVQEEWAKGSGARAAYGVPVNSACRSVFFANLCCQCASTARRDPPRKRRVGRGPRSPLRT